MFDRSFTGFLSLPPFEMLHRPDSLDDEADFKIVAYGLDLHSSVGDYGWRALKGDPSGKNSYAVFSTLPSSDFFNETWNEIKDSVYLDPESKEKALSALKQVFSILSSLPRIRIRANENKRTIEVKSGYFDIFFREMIKTHFYALWNNEDKIWTLKTKDKKEYDSVIRALEIFAKNKKRFIIPQEVPFDVPKEPLKNQEFALARISDAGLQGKRAFLVAHDMGLGKTYTALATLKSFMENNSGKGGIAFVLSSTFKQWMEAAKEFGMSYHLFHSSARKKDNIVDIDEADIVITNVEYIKENPDRLLKTVELSENRIFIADEATKFKNIASDNSRTAVPVSLASNFVLFLSGTPIINSINEMENLILLGDPTYYPYKEFKENHEKEEIIQIYNPIRRKRQEVRKVEYINEKMFGNRVVSFYDREVKRGKNLDTGIILPELDKKTIYVKPDSMELLIVDILRQEYKTIYKKNIDEAKTLEQLARGYTSKSGSAIIYEQMIINSPGCLFESRSESEILQAVLERITSEIGVEKVKEHTTGKMKALFSILEEEECRKNPVVIFTFFKTVANELKQRLEERFPDRDVFFATGDNSRLQKDKAVEGLKESFNGIMICTDAMNYGVELQFASTVIQYDLPWSPFIADQRNDRIDRIGAKGKRRIRFIVAKNTMEMSKVELHRKKRQTAVNVFGKEEKETKSIFDSTDDEAQENLKKPDGKTKNKTENHSTDLSESVAQNIQFTLF